ncbi:MAG: myo-inositol-1(or 4)-monophosphatase [Kiritimatiellia bacterium]|jgi:myo-inositol-1(or 4)-monophosphatase
MVLTDLERACLERHGGNIDSEPTAPPETAEQWKSLIIELSLEVGRRVRHARTQDFGGNTEFKGDGSPVTTLEQDIERWIEDQLAIRAPGTHLAGEESGGAIQPTGATLVIDPIDGTWAFLGRGDTSAVAVALFVDGEIVAAVVVNPATAELVHASSTSQTRLMQLSALGEEAQGWALPLEGYQSERPLVRAQTGRSGARMLGLLQDAWRRQELAIVSVPGGSPALALALVSKGVITYVNEWAGKAASPYDLAAGIFLVRRAGGDVIDLDGSPVDPVVHRGPFVAGMNPRHRETVRAIVHASRLEDRP